MAVRVKRNEFWINIVWIERRVEMVGEMTWGVMMTDEVTTDVGQKFILVDWRKLIGHPRRKSTGELSVAWLVHMGLSDSALHPKNLNLRTHKLPTHTQTELRDYYSRGHSSISCILHVCLFAW